MLYAVLLFTLIRNGISNALRGSGDVRKVIVYAVSNAILLGGIMWFAPSYWYVAIAMFAIDWGCNSFGWGDFFPHGRLDTDGKDGGFKPARWVADRFYNSKDEDEILKWQITGMTARFVLTFGLLGVPLLSYLIDNVTYLLAILPYFLSGILYRIPFAIGENENTLRIAEFLNGFVTHGTTRAYLLYLLYIS